MMIYIKEDRPQPNLAHSGPLPGFVWPPALLELASTVSHRDQQVHLLTVSTFTLSATLLLS